MIRRRSQRKGRRARRGIDYSLQHISARTGDRGGTAVDSVSASAAAGIGMWLAISGQGAGCIGAGRMRHARRMQGACTAKGASGAF
jgi:hypothetical protein